MKLNHIVLVIGLFFIKTACLGRSIHRPKDTAMACITTSREDEPSSKTSCYNSHFELHTFFGTFDKKFFFDHTMPATISYRYHPEQSIASCILNTCIEHLLEEINQRKKTYRDFTILTKKNFNRKKRVGMLILKFKQYPFVVKLFIETPQTFINPYCKGIDNVWFFHLGGGVNRHIAGFTRVKNLCEIKKQLEQHPRWSSLIDMPRKWYWAPATIPWLTITGTNIGGLKHISTKIPGVYAIVADEIASERELSLWNTADTTIALELCNDLDHVIDAHINNFLVEKNSGKIIIIDTEHFPTVVGFNNTLKFSNYFSWYSCLARRWLYSGFFRTKEERYNAQQASLQKMLTTNKQYFPQVVLT